MSNQVKSKAVNLLVDAIIQESAFFLFVTGRNDRQRPGDPAAAAQVPAEVGRLPAARRLARRRNVHGRGGLPRLGLGHRAAGSAAGGRRRRRHRRRPAAARQRPGEPHPPEAQASRPDAAGLGRVRRRRPPLGRLARHLQARRPRIRTRLRYT